MSAYNVLHASATCPECGHDVKIAAQFKFGNAHQFEYAIADALRWGGNDIGEARWRHVVVDAVSETPCPNCGFDREWNLYIHVENNRIARLESATGEHDFSRLGKTYVVLRE